MASPYTKSMYLLVISEWEIAARSLPCNIKCPPTFYKPEVFILEPYYYLDNTIYTKKYAMITTNTKTFVFTRI
jgi:hypothetical protein